MSSDQQEKKSYQPTLNEKGEFVRKDSVFRNFITADGSSGFRAEEGRYHLYVSLACPWAHRVLLVRRLKGLEHVLPYTVVDWLMGDKGWAFTDKKPKCTLDPVNNCQYLRDVYRKADPDYSGRVTVPCLWDKQQHTVVNNESSEIIRMLNTEFNALCKTEEQKLLHLYPEHLKDKIDEVNAWIYPMINNGVYRAGFAKSQEAYDAAVKEVFEGLDKVEEILSKNRYLVGKEFTEADVRLFTTLVRFDNVYNTHFKCNRRRVSDYPHTFGFTREIYQMPGVAETVDMEHIMKHYYQSHLMINPTGIVAVGPQPDFTAPHGRDSL